MTFGCGYFAYNFIKIHRILRVTPAMAAGVTTHLFDVMDLLNLLIESKKKAASLLEWRPETT